MGWCKTAKVGARRNAAPAHALGPNSPAEAMPLRAGTRLVGDRVGWSVKAGFRGLRGGGHRATSCRADARSRPYGAVHTAPDASLLLKNDDFGRMQASSPPRRPTIWWQRRSAGDALKIVGPVISNRGPTECQCRPTRKQHRLSFFLANRTRWDRGVLVKSGRLAGRRALG